MIAEEIDAPLGCTFRNGNAAGERKELVLKTETASRVIAAGAICEDHVCIVRKNDVVLLIVADGAGGQAGGGAAAQFVVAEATDRFDQTSNAIDPLTWVTWLREIDRTIELHPDRGETTVTLCAIEGGELVGGASVGDSEAMLITDLAITHLTRGQKRKPLLGSGRADPHPFFLRRTSGTILLATDGLFKYAARQKIVEIIRRAVLAEVADQLVTAARLPSGHLQDDLGLALFRS